MIKHETLHEGYLEVIDQNKTMTQLRCDPITDDVITSGARNFKMLKFQFYVYQMKACLVLSIFDKTTMLKKFEEVTDPHI